MDNRKSVLEQKRRDDIIVKCACGLTMRQKNWSDHWMKCKYASGVPVTEEDEANLHSYEQRRQNQALEHEQWLRNRKHPGCGLF
jgi:hypothetical protein